MRLRSALRGGSLGAVAGAALVGVPLAAASVTMRRAADRLIHPAPTTAAEATLGPAVDALGGEVVRLRARDGLRLAARWLPAEPDPNGDWIPEWNEAVVLLHGYSGSVAPDAIEYGPFLRHTAGVLALDFRGHGGSEPSPTTFGLREIEDVAGALAWLGERGVVRVALFGTSMGGIAAIAAAVMLGDGRLEAPDVEQAAPVAPAPPARPRIVGLVVDSVAPELRVVIEHRLPGPVRGFVADRLLDAVGRTLGEDPRAVDPIRIGALLEDLPVLMIHGAADSTVPERDGRRLAEGLAGAGVPVEHWLAPGAEHSLAHATMPDEYERRVTSFLRRILAAARPAPPAESSEPGAILPAPSSG